MSSKKSTKQSKPKSPEPICAITLTPLSQLSDEEKMFLPCSHGFDKNAILTHLRRVAAECPVCRTSIHVSATELGLTTETPESEKPTKCMEDVESENEDDEEMEDDEDSSSATLDSEEPRSEETGSMGSLREFIEEDDEESVDDEEKDYVPTDEEEDDTISSEVASDEEEYEGESDSESAAESDSE